MMGLNDFFEYEFLGLAFIAIVLLSLIAGILSPLIIAKKYAFMGASISHSALLGIALGLYFFGESFDIQLFFLTLSVTVLLSLFLGKATYRQSLPSDGAIGVFYTSTMGLAVLIHQSANEVQGDLLGYLFGNILLLSKVDLIILAIILIITFLCIFIPFKKWLLYITDEEAALVQGVSLPLFHYGLIALLTLVIVSAVKVSGTVLINTLLLVPGLFALKIAKSAQSAFYVATLFSLFSGVVALVLANALGLPIGATLAVFQLALLILQNSYLKLSKA